MCPGPHQNQGWGWRRKTGLSPPVKYFTDRSKEVLLLWIFYVFVLSCVCYVLCASVYMCFVVTCWERADLLALVCGVFCEYVTFPLVSWVRCGTLLYRFLIFATLLTMLKCHFLQWLWMVGILLTAMDIEFMSLQCITPTIGLVADHCVYIFLRFSAFLQ